MNRIYILLFVVVLLIPGSAYSQNTMYNTGKKKGGNPLDADGSGLPVHVLMWKDETVNLSSRWGGSISYGFYHTREHDIPSFFPSGYITKNPSDLLKTYSARLTRNFTIGSNLARAGIDGGLTWFYNKHFYFIENASWQQGDGQLPFCDLTRVQNTIGISLRLRTEFPVSRYAGMEMAIIALAGSYNFFIGGGIYFSGGIFRKRVRDAKSTSDRNAWITRRFNSSSNYYALPGMAGTAYLRNEKQWKQHGINQISFADYAH